MFTEGCDETKKGEGERPHLQHGEGSLWGKAMALGKV